jgi:hypothetical protein
MKIRAVGAEMLRSEGHTHKHTHTHRHMTHLTDTFAILRTHIKKKKKTCNTRSRKQDPFPSSGTKVDWRAPTQMAPAQTATINLWTLKFASQYFTPST